MTYKFFDTKVAASAATEEMRDDESADFCDVKWTGPNVYFIKNESRRCPRGCCYDSWMVARPVEERIEVIKEEMVALATKLKEARTALVTHMWRP